MFQVRDDTPREPPVPRAVLLPEVWLRIERGLQRGEKRRSEASPCGAYVVGLRRTRKRAPESRDVERERRF